MKIEGLMNKQQIGEVRVKIEAVMDIANTASAKHKESLPEVRDEMDKIFWALYGIRHELIGKELK